MQHLLQLVGMSILDGLVQLFCKTLNATSFTTAASYMRPDCDNSINSKSLNGLLLRKKMPYLTHWHISFGIPLCQRMALAKRLTSSIVEFSVGRLTRFAFVAFGDSWRTSRRHRRHFDDVDIVRQLNWGWGHPVIRTSWGLEEKMLD